MKTRTLRRKRLALNSNPEGCNQWTGPGCGVGKGGEESPADVAASHSKVIARLLKVDYDSPPGDSTTPLTSKFGDALKNAKGMWPNAKERYAVQFATMLSKMPQKARDRIQDQVRDVHVYRDSEQLTKAHMEDRGQEHRGQSNTGGTYNVLTGTLRIDGDIETQADASGGTRINARETYAHELTHAIDGVGLVHSSSDAWANAYKSEVYAPTTHAAPLSWYACKDSSEGFAEFGRLLYGTDMDRDRVQRYFPKCFDYFKSQGLI